MRYSNHNTNQPDAYKIKQEKQNGRFVDFNAVLSLSDSHRRLSIIRDSDAYLYLLYEHFLWILCWIYYLSKICISVVSKLFIRYTTLIINYNAIKVLVNYIWIGGSNIYTRRKMYNCVVDQFQKFELFIHWGLKLASQFSQLTQWIVQI